MTRVHGVRREGSAKSDETERMWCGISSQAEVPFVTGDPLSVHNTLATRTWNARRIGQEPCLNCLRASNAYIRKGY